jgi:heme-degrading monooxygenase HmoA
MTAPNPIASFLSYSRWTLKRNADVGDVLKLFREVVRPAYGQIPGCLSLTLLEIIDESRTYLAIAAWDTRDDYDAWVRTADDWREANQGAFKQWQSVMDFEDEFQASILYEG